MRRFFPQTHFSFVESKVTFVKLRNCVIFPAKCTDHTDTGQVFSGKTGDGIQTSLYFLKEDTSEHDHKDNQEQYRDGNYEDQRTAHVDGKGHHHGTENNERASKKKTKAHVYTVLYLVYIVSQTGDQGIGSKGIQLRIGKLLDVVKDCLAYFCGKTYAGFCRKKP